MACKLEEVINDGTDYGVMENALQGVEYGKRLNAGVNRANRYGKYAIPSKRILPYVDKHADLVGKTLTLEDIDYNRFKDVKITKVETLETDIVRLNGEYDVNVRTSMLTNGTKLITLGSEKSEVDKRNTEMLGILTGTVVDDIDGLVEAAVSLDGGRLNPHLQKVFNMYKDVLVEAGENVKLDVEFMKDLDNKRTVGESTPELGRLKLVSGSTRFNSHSDILAHELQHTMLKNVLSDNTVLRANILKLRDVVAEQIDYHVFLPKGKPTKEDIEFAKERWDYVFRNDNVDVAADEFLAAATTNEKLVNALGLITDLSDYKLVDTVDIKPGEKSKWKRLWNNIAKIVNAAYVNIKFKGKSARELTLDMLHTALELQHSANKKAEMSVFEKLIDKINVVDSKIEAITKIEKKAQRSYADYVASSDKSKLQKAIDMVWKIRGMAKAKSYILQNNIFSSITRDMSNKDVAKFYQMFRHAKAFVENAVAPVKHFTVDVLENNYHLGRLTPQQRRAAKRVLIDTDAKAIGTSKEILEYLQDDMKLDKELVAFADRYKDKKEVITATEQLGRLLVDNSNTQANGYTNAAQIGYTYLETSTGKEVDEINRIASLIALKYSAQENKELVIEAMTKQDTDAQGNSIDFMRGFDHAMKLMEINERKVLIEAYSGDTMYQVKGAKQETYADDKRYYIVEEKEVKDLVRAKLHNIGKHEALSKAVGKNMYIVVGDSMEVGFTEGLMSKVQLKNEGDSVRRILMEVNELTQEEADDAIDALIKSQEDGKDVLIPERSGRNEIYDYRVRIPHEVKSKYLGIEDDILPTVASTVADLTHKQEAMVANREAIEYFDEFHEKYGKSNDFKFIEISEKSEGKMKEYWDSIPYYLKADVQNKLGGKLMIEESMLVDFFGYKDMSIANAAWIKNSKKRQIVARKAEKVVQEITQAWKHAVVAKTASTILGNNGSNMVIAMQHTTDKNPLNYLVRFKEMWSYMNQYQEDRRNKVKMEIRASAGEEIDYKELKKLTVRMETNPVYPIMQDGQYTAILEDLNSSWINDKGIIEDKLDEVLNKLKRKKDKVGIKEVIDTLYVRKDSPMYDSMMKMTTYADAITKMIIQQDLDAEYNKAKTQEDKDNTFAGKLGGKDATKAEVRQAVLNYVDGLTVNYSYLDNRGIKYANDTLIFSFTKYFFRVFPAMMKMLGRKAGTVFLTESAQGLSGLNIETPWDQYYSPINSVTRKVGGWCDPINIFEMIMTPAIAK